MNRDTALFDRSVRSFQSRHHLKARGTRADLSAAEERFQIDQWRSGLTDRVDTFSKCRMWFVRSGFLRFAPQPVHFKVCHANEKPSSPTSTRRLLMKNRRHTASHLIGRIGE